MVSRKIHLRQLIGVRDEKKGRLFTTVGRILFSQLLPEGLDFVNEPINSKMIKGILTEVFRRYSRKEYVNLVDKIKDFGFWGMSLSGISLAISDCGRLEERKKLLKRQRRKLRQ